MATMKIKRIMYKNLILLKFYRFFIKYKKNLKIYLNYKI